MGRKSNNANSADKLHRATADAAQVLARDLAAHSAVLNIYLTRAGEENDTYQRHRLLDTADMMVQSMTKLGATLGRLTGLHQHIRVERNAAADEIGPQTAPNSASPPAQISMQSAANAVPAGARPRGEGV